MIEEEKKMEGDNRLQAAIKHLEMLEEEQFRNRPPKERKDLQ